MHFDELYTSDQCETYGTRVYWAIESSVLHKEKKNNFKLLLSHKVIIINIIIYNHRYR